MLEIDNLEPNVKNICNKLLSEGIDIVDIIISSNPYIELNQGYSIQVENNKYHLIYDENRFSSLEYDSVYYTSNIDEIIDVIKNLFDVKKLHSNAYISTLGDDDVV